MKIKNEAAGSGPPVGFSGAKAPATRKKLSVGYFLVAFVAALTLWFYVADYDTVVEKTFPKISVELIFPEKKDLVVESGEGQFVNVTVRGKKADINEMKAKDIRAYVDVSSKSDAGEFDAEILVELPPGISLAEKNALSPTHIIVALSQPTVKEFELEADILGSWDDDYILTPECEPERIRITGTRSVIEKVEKARVGINVGNLERPKQVRGRIELIDKKGDALPQNYIKMTDTGGNEILNGIAEVYVRIDIEKELPVFVEFTGGVFKAEDANITCSPQTVVVTGGVEKLKKMESVIVSLDEKEITEKVYEGLLPLPDMEKENIFYKDGITDVKVSVKLVDILRTAIGFTAEDIKAVGLPEGLEAKFRFKEDEKSGKIPEKAEIIVRGYRESINSLRREQLKLVGLEVDFSEFADSEEGIKAGQAYESLAVNVSFADLQGVFTTDKIEVSAEIEEASEESGES